jgi:sulfur-oxidizing protein SoxX
LASDPDLDPAASREPRPTPRGGHCRAGRWRQCSRRLIVGLVTMAVGALWTVANATTGSARPDELPALTSEPGDVARGRLIVVDRYKGLCLLCHSGPFSEQAFQGNFAPDLGDVGLRLTPGQLRLRIADGQSLNPHTIMPSYHRTEGLHRVAPAFAGKPILTAQEVEDVVMFLTTLRGGPSTVSKP